MLLIEGYDEFTSGLNLFSILNLDDWAKAQKIVTARIGSFPVEQFDSVEQFFIAPFDADTRKEFLLKFIETKYQLAINQLLITKTQEQMQVKNSQSDTEIYLPGLTSEETKKFLNEIKEAIKEKLNNELEELNGTEDLRTNPFILKMLIEALPVLIDKKKTISRADIYDAFISQYYEKKKKLITSSESGFSNQQLEGLFANGYNFSDAFNRFAQSLATAMWAQNIVAAPIQPLTYLSPELQQYNKFKPLLDNKLPKAQLRNEIHLFCTPATKTGNNVTFIHKSIRDYYVACKIFEEILALVKHFASDVINFKNNKISAVLLKEYCLHQSRINKEYEILRFLQDKLENEYADDFQPLVKVVRASRNNSEISPEIVANILTILVFMHYPLSGVDLSHLDLSYADLSGGVFDQTNFEGSKLKGVDLENSWIGRANFTGADLDDLRLGQQPYLSSKDPFPSEPEKSIQTAVYSPNKNLLAVASEEFVFLYKANTDNTWTFARVIKRKNQQGKVCHLIFSPDSKQLLTLRDKDPDSPWDQKEYICNHWNLEPLKLFSEFTVYGNGDYQIQYSPDSTVIAAMVGQKEQQRVKLYYLELDATIKKKPPSPLPSTSKVTCFSFYSSIIFDDETHKPISLLYVCDSNLTIHIFNTHDLEEEPIEVLVEKTQLAQFGEKEIFIREIKIYPTDNNVLCLFLSNAQIVMGTINNASNDEEDNKKIFTISTIISAPAENTGNDLVEDIQFNNDWSKFVIAYKSIAKDKIQHLHVYERTKKEKNNKNHSVSNQYERGATITYYNPIKAVSKSPKYTIKCISISNKGDLLAVGCQDGTVHLWNIKNKDNEDIYIADFKHKSAVTSLSFNTLESNSAEPNIDANLTTTSEDGTVRFWDTTIQRQTQDKSDHSVYNPIVDLHYNADGTELKAIGLTNTSVLKVTNGKFVRTLSSIENPAYKGIIAFYNSKYGSSQSVIEFDIDAQAKVKAADEDKADENKLTASPKKEVNIVNVIESDEASDPTLKKENAITVTQVRHYLVDQDKKPITHLQFSSDGTRVVSISENNKVKVWEFNAEQDKNELTELSSFLINNPILNCHISSNKLFIISKKNQDEMEIQQYDGAHITNNNKKTLIWKVKSSEKSIVKMDVSNKYLVASDNQTIYVGAIETDKVETRFIFRSQNQFEPIVGFQIDYANLDDSLMFRMYAMHADGKINIWDVPKAYSKTILSNQVNQINSLISVPHKSYDIKVNVTALVTPAVTKSLEKIIVISGNNIVVYTIGIHPPLLIDCGFEIGTAEFDAQGEYLLVTSKAEGTQNINNNSSLETYMLVIGFSDNKPYLVPVANQFANKIGCMAIAPHFNKKVLAIGVGEELQVIDLFNTSLANDKFKQFCKDDSSYQLKERQAKDFLKIAIQYHNQENPHDAIELNIEALSYEELEQHLGAFADLSLIRENLKKAFKQRQESKSAYEQSRHEQKIVVVSEIKETTNNQNNNQIDVVTTKETTPVKNTAVARLKERQFTVTDLNEKKLEETLKQHATHEPILDNNNSPSVARRSKLVKQPSDINQLEAMEKALAKTIFQQEPQLAAIYETLATNENLSIRKDQSGKFDVIPDLKFKMFTRTQEICAFGSRYGTIWLYRKREDVVNLKTWQLMWWKPIHQQMYTQKVNIQDTENVSNATYLLLTQISTVAGKTTILGKPLINKKQYPNWTKYHLDVATNAIKAIEENLIKNKETWLDEKTPLERWTPLHIACKFGNAQAAKLLLDNGADYTATDQNGNFPGDIILSAHRGEFVGLVPQRDPERLGRPLLMVAIYNAVESLNKAKPKEDEIKLIEQDLKQKYPVLAYILSREDKIEQHLNEREEQTSDDDPLRSSQSDSTVGFGPIHLLIKYANNYNFFLFNKLIEIIKSKDITITNRATNGNYRSEQPSQNQEQQIVTKKSVINLKDDRGKAPIHHVVESNSETAIKMFNLLLDFGKEIDLIAKDLDGNTPLHLLIPALTQRLEVQSETESQENKNEKEKSKTIEELLIEKIAEESNANLNILNTPLKKESDPEAQAALHLAVLNELPFVVERLLHFGAEPFVKNNKSQTPLQLAAEIDPKENPNSNAYQIFKSLINKKNSLADIDYNDDKVEHRSALHIAVLKGYKIYVRELLIQGASLWVQDKDGRTVLHQALDTPNVNEDVVSILLRHSGNFLLVRTTNSEVTVEQQDENQSQQTRIAALKEKINSKDNLKRSILFLAAASNNTRIVESIFKLGADSLKLTQNKHVGSDKTEWELLLDAYSQGHISAEIIYLILAKMIKELEKDYTAYDLKVNQYVSQLNSTWLDWVKKYNSTHIEVISITKLLNAQYHCYFYLKDKNLEYVFTELQSRTIFPAVSANNNNVQSENDNTQPEVEIGGTIIHWMMEHSSDEEMIIKFINLYKDLVSNFSISNIQEKYYYLHEASCFKKTTRITQHLINLGCNVMDKNAENKSVLELADENVKKNLIKQQLDYYNTESVDVQYNENIRKFIRIADEVKDSEIEKKLNELTQKIENIIKTQIESYQERKDALSDEDVADIKKLLHWAMCSLCTTQASHLFELIKSKIITEDKGYLHEATQAGMLTLAIDLIERGFSIMELYDGKTTLEIALAKKNSTTVETLLMKQLEYWQQQVPGRDEIAKTIVNTQANGKTIIHWAMEFATEQTLIELLKFSTLAPNKTLDSNNKDYLHYFIHFAHRFSAPEKIIDILVQKGFVLNSSPAPLSSTGPVFTYLQQALIDEKTNPDFVSLLVRDKSQWNSDLLRWAADYKDNKEKDNEKRQVLIKLLKAIKHWYEKHPKENPALYKNDVKLLQYISVTKDMKILGEIIQLQLKWFENEKKKNNDEFLKFLKDESSITGNELFEKARKCEEHLINTGSDDYAFVKDFVSRLLEIRILQLGKLPNDPQVSSLLVFTDNSKISKYAGAKPVYEADTEQAAKLIGLQVQWWERNKDNLLNDPQIHVSQNLNKTFIKRYFDAISNDTWLIKEWHPQQTDIHGNKSLAILRLIEIQMAYYNKLASSPNHNNNKMTTMSSVDSEGRSLLSWFLEHVNAISPEHIKNIKILIEGMEPSVFLKPVTINKKKTSILQEFTEKDDLQFVEMIIKKLPSPPTEEEVTKINGIVNLYSVKGVGSKRLKVVGRKSTYLPLKNYLGTQFVDKDEVLKQKIISKFTPNFLSDTEMENIIKFVSENETNDLITAFITAYNSQFSKGLDLAELNKRCNNQVTIEKIAQALDLKIQLVEIDDKKEKVDAKFFAKPGAQNIPEHRIIYLLKFNNNFYSIIQPKAAEFKLADQKREEEKAKKVAQNLNQNRTITAPKAIEDYSFKDFLKEATNRNTLLTQNQPTITIIFSKKEVAEKFVQKIKDDLQYGEACIVSFVPPSEVTNNNQDNTQNNDNNEKKDEAKTYLVEITKDAFDKMMDGSTTLEEAPPPPPPPRPQPTQIRIH